MSKVKIHTVYKTLSGEKVPSVTTVLGILNKPALLDWAWKCGLSGEDYKAVRGQAAGIGTLAHYLILCDIKGEEPDVSEYSPQDVSQAETCLIKYWEWKKSNPIKPILVEKPLVSEKYHYGGTLDFFGQRDTGECVLVDFKTGKAIYSEHFIQLSAYENLLAEHGHRFDKTIVLRIGRDETEGFEIRSIGNLDKHFELFTHCLAIYNLKKELKS